MKKKLLAMLLSLSMVAAMAGCGNDGGEPAQGSGSSESSSAQDSAQQDGSADSGAEESSSVEEPEEPAYDFGGLTLKIGFFNDGGMPDPESSAWAEAYYNRIKYVEQNYNCHVEYVNCNSPTHKKYITSVLAGDPIVDIGYILSDQIPSLVEGGIIQPLDSFDSYNMDDYKWRPDTTELARYKGHYYATLMRNYETGYGIFWNKTLFQKYNLPDLYELYDNGEWTWEKFEEVAAAGNVDLDSDGTIDIYGLAANDKLPWNYLYTNGCEVVKAEDDGLHVDLSDPKVIESLTALQKFIANVEFRDEIDWSTEAWDAFNTGFRDGKYMMLMEATWVASYFEAADGGMADDWGWVPFPKGPSADGVICFNSGAGVYGMLNGIENAEEKALIYNLITDIADSEEEWDELINAQMENWARDQESVDNATALLNSIVMSPVYGYSDVNKAITDMIAEVRSSAMTPQVAIESYQSQIDKAVEDLATHDYKADMDAVVAEEQEKEAAAAAEAEGDGEAEE